MKIVSKIPPIHCLNAILQESFAQGSTKDTRWVTIQNPSVARLILASLGDEDKKNILNSVLDEPRTFMEIMEITGLPASSSYRKICTLIDNGLLTDLNSNIHSDGKRKIKYKSIFQNIEINIEKNKIVIKILLTKESMEKSIAIQTIQC